MAEQQKQYITPETKAKLEAELQELIDHRPVVAAEINERREEGDLKENAGYDAARETVSYTHLTLPTILLV